MAKIFKKFSLFFSFNFLEEPDREPVCCASRHSEEDGFQFIGAVTGENAKVFINTWYPKTDNVSTDIKKGALYFYIDEDPNNDGGKTKVAIDGLIDMTDYNNVMSVGAVPIYDDEVDYFLEMVESLFNPPKEEGSDESEKL